MLEATGSVGEERFMSNVGRYSLVWALMGVMTTAVVVADRANADEFRKWKDRSGEHEVEAAYVGFIGTTVTLKQRNGEQLEIKVTDLSQDDIHYVMELRIKRAVPNEKERRGGDDLFSKLTQPGLGAPVDWGMARLIQAPVSNSWNRIAIIPAAARKAKTVRLPPTRDHFEHRTGIVTGEGFAIIGYDLQDGLRRGIAETTRLVRIDLESGKVEGTIIVDGAYQLLDTSPKGDELLMLKRNSLLSGGTTLEIWSPTGTTVERKKTISPLAGGLAPESIEWAAFGAGGNILVQDRGHRFGIFNRETLKPVATAPVTWIAARSLDGKYAAVLTRAVEGLPGAGLAGLTIVDVASGESLASVPLEGDTETLVSFSSDGKRLATAHRNHIKVWNLNDGSVYRDEAFAGLEVTSSLVWTSPTHVFLWPRILVDLENRLPVWAYDEVEEVIPYGDGVLVPMRNTPGDILVAATMPHAAAKAAVKQLLATQRQFAISPNAKVSIDVSSLPDVAQQPKARAGLEARLKAAGFQVADGSPIVLKASITSEAVKRTARMAGPKLQDQTVNTTRSIAKVEFLINGQSAWSTTSVTGDFIYVTRRPGESLEQAVQRENQPDYGFFTTVSIPPFVLPPGTKTLGTSSASSTGL